MLAGETPHAVDYANAEAIDLYRRALRHASAEPVPPPMRSRVLPRHSETSISSRAWYRDAMGAYSERAPTARTSKRGRARESCERSATSVNEKDDSPRRWARTAVRTAWSNASRTRPACRHEQAEIALSRAGALNRQGRNRESARYAEIAAASTQKPVGIAWAWQGRTTSCGWLRVARWARCRRVGERALEMYEGSGDLVGEANVVNNLGIDTYFVGDWRSGCRYPREPGSSPRGGRRGRRSACRQQPCRGVIRSRVDTTRQIDLFEFARRTWEARDTRSARRSPPPILPCAQARSGEPRAGLATLGSARFLSQQVGASSLSLEIDIRRIECLLFGGKPGLALTEAIPLYDELVAAHEGDEEFTTQLLPLIAVAQWATGEHRTVRADAVSNDRTGRGRVEPLHRGARLSGRRRAGAGARR